MVKQNQITHKIQIHEGGLGLLFLGGAGGQDDITIQHTYKAHENQITQINHIFNCCRQL